MSAEAQWVERLTAGSEHRDAALAELRQVLSRQLTRAFRDAGADFIEDTVQDALLKILANIQKFDSRSRFTTWAMTIAVRTGYTELRRRRWRDVSWDQIVEQRGGDIAESNEPHPQPHSALARRRLQQSLVRNDAIGQAHPLRLLGLDLSTGHQELGCATATNDPGK